MDSSQLSSSEKLHFNNLFSSAKVKPFIWTVLLFEGIKMTAFNRPNTERSERLQIINRSDCYLESLPVQQQQAAILQSKFRKTSGNFLLVLSRLHLGKGRVDLLIPPVVMVIFLPGNSSVYSEGAAWSRLVTFQAGQLGVTSHHYLNTNNVSSHCSNH